MTRSEVDSFLEDASRNERFLTRSGVREQRCRRKAAARALAVTGGCADLLVQP
jgi:hypothetical protein